MRVLVVSEDPAELDRASSALHLIEGVEVDLADSAGGATERVQGASYDVLVVDGDLYPKGGFSWLYELHAAADLGATVAPPAVVLTSRPQDSWLADWARAQAVARKPVDPFELTTQVRRLGELATPA